MPPTEPQQKNIHNYSQSGLFIILGGQHNELNLAQLPLRLEVNQTKTTTAAAAAAGGGAGDGLGGIRASSKQQQQQQAAPFAAITTTTAASVRRAANYLPPLKPPPPPPLPVRLHSLGDVYSKHKQSNQNCTGI